MVDISLPEDLDHTLPPEPTAWLRQYFEHKEIPTHIFWSEKKKLLIFPIYDKDYHLLAWQGRNFNKEDPVPKWLSFGISDNLFHILPIHARPNDTIILVEDIISAEKLATVGHNNNNNKYHVMPIFGSNISFERLIKLKQLGYTKIIIWLDFDKRAEQVVFARKAMSLGLEVRSISTELDPKELTKEQIIHELSLSS